MLHNWALPTSQWCEWLFNTLFFRLHLLKHPKFVKICPFFNNVLCSSRCKANDFESLVKDDVVIHFDTWVNESNPLLPQVFKEHHHHPNSCPQTLI
jgi:hypothetical protein